MTAPRVLGIDYASVDGDSPPDFAKAYVAGARFVYIRKSYAAWDSAHQAWALLPDRFYARDAAAARAAGLYVGAYAFWTFAKGGPSAAAQVANFVAAPGEILPGRDLPPCTDVEFPGKGIADTGRTQGECFQFHLELVDALRARVGCWPATYTSHVEWCDDNGLGSPAWSDAVKSALWIKIPYREAAHQPVDQVAPREPHYGNDPTDRADLYRVPPPWTGSGWWLRQSQGDVIGFPGFDRTVDVDDFHGCQLGDRDPRVAYVQRALGTTPDGDYGPKTDAAVRAFQLAHGLAQGPVDLATFVALAWSLKG